MNPQEKSPIREAVKQHDRYQFETRFDYSLETRRRKPFDLRKKITYHMDAYFFIPKQMGINAETYKKSHFYEDIRPLIRFKEPHFSFKDFETSREDRESPLVRLEEILKLLTDIRDPLRQEHASEAIDLIKYFACCFVSNFRRKIRKRCRLIKESIAIPKIENDHSLEKLFVDLDPFLRRHFSLLRRFADLRNRFPVHEDLRETLILEMLLAEEYCFYRFREGIAEIVETVDQVRNIQVSEYLAAKKKLRVWARFIFWFERSRHFMSVDETSTVIERERFLSRLGSIKKYLSRILYLEVKPNAYFAIRSQTGYMLAAGLAAFFYFLANLMIFSYLHFGGFGSAGGVSNLVGFGGATVVFAFVVAYILKDRIKEIGRVRFQSGVLGKLPDHTNNIFYTNSNGTQTIIGKVKEAVDFVRNFDSVPQEIHQIREKSDLWDEEGQFSLLFYRRTFELDFGAVKRLKPQFTTVKDIIRFSIRRYLTKLDDPVQIYLGLDRRGSVQEMGMPKVYYIGVAIRFFSGNLNGTSGFDHQVLVVDKNGLVRIDEVAKSVRVEK